ncbi:MAG: hypothetical protein AAGA53_07300 [Pseudomonadota bacterium]
MMEYDEDDDDFEYNRSIIRDGLVLHEKYARTAETQEAEREGYDHTLVLTFMTYTRCILCHGFS